MLSPLFFGSSARPNLIKKKGFLWKKALTSKYLNNEYTNISVLFLTKKRERGVGAYVSVIERPERCAAALHLGAFRPWTPPCSIPPSPRPPHPPPHSPFSPAPASHTSLLSTVSPPHHPPPHATTACHRLCDPALPHRLHSSFLSLIVPLGVSAEGLHARLRY